MATDTAAKRFSMLDFDLPFQPGMPPPDGVIDADDRFSFLWIYRMVSAVIVNLVAPKVFGGWQRGLEFRIGVGVYDQPFDDNASTYQWYKDGVAVPGQTGHRYRPGRGVLGSTVHFTETVVDTTTSSDEVTVTKFVLDGYRSRGV